MTRERENGMKRCRHETHPGMASAGSDSTDPAVVVLVPVEPVRSGIGAVELALPRGFFGRSLPAVGAFRA